MEEQGTQSLPWGWVVVGIIVAAVIGGIVGFIIEKAGTRPIQQGFYGGAISGSSSFPCSRMSSEAEELLSMFSGRSLSAGEEGKVDLISLRELLSKMCCMKQDLMSPAQTLTAAKELGFATHTDIQPVADLTTRCFAKTIPERDLSIQFAKWRDFAEAMINRLCTASNMNEKEVQKAEALFKAVWNDIYNVAQTQCLVGPPNGMYQRNPHDPEAKTPEDIINLRPYDGYY
jgi:hypothetical protein